MKKRNIYLDAVGNAHAPCEEARIVSLVPSITETLFALSLGASVVGRTRFCTGPAETIDGIVTVGGTKHVDLEHIRRLEPSHVIVNVDETPRAVADALATMGIAVVVTHPLKAIDNVALFRLLGGVFGRQAEAGHLHERFKAAYEELVAAAAAWPSRRVLYLIWRKPWMTVSAETYIADMLITAKWVVHAPSGGDRYPTIEIDADLLASVDAVLLSTEPFPFTEADAQTFVEAYPTAAGKTRLIDGAMLSWYGKRAIDGLAYLRRVAAEARQVVRSG